MRNIFISGNLFSWNLGTMAMVLSLIKQFSNDDYFYYKASVELDNDIKRYSKDKEIKNLLIFGFNKRFLPMAIASPLLLLFSIKWIKKSDIVLAVSGEISSDINLYSQFFRFIEAKIFKKKFIIFGCSLGPFKSPLAIFLARFFYNRVDGLMIRESETKRYLEEIGVKKKLLTSDHTLLLSSIKNNRLEKLTKKAGHFIGISVKDKYFNNRNYREKINELINYISCILNTSVIIIPHSREDIIASEAIHNENNYPNVFLIRDEYLPTELKWLISKADFFVGSRIHACLSALSSCVPTIVIIPLFDHRSLGFMSDFGLENVIVDPCTNEDFLSVFKKYYKIRNALKIKIKEKLPILKRRAILNYRYIDKILER